MVSNESNELPFKATQEVLNISNPLKLIRDHQFRVVSIKDTEHINDLKSVRGGHFALILPP